MTQLEFSNFLYKHSRLNATIAIILVILTCSCKNNKAAKTETLKQNEISINKIEINLWPAFNNSSVIEIDKVSVTVKYKVDTTLKWRGKTPSIFSTNLDSFETNTLVDSFYSQSFLDSIRFKPGNVVRDGLSIFTVVKRGNISDTINSGNVFPKILIANIISQIDYISENTKDRQLINYLEDLKSYLE